MATPQLPHHWGTHRGHIGAPAFGRLPGRTTVLARLSEDAHG